VADAAVIGVPHPRWVETPIAFIVPNGPAEPGEGELIAHCRQYLAGYKKPSAIIVVDELPRNAAGKVLKRRLRETYSDQLSAVME
jgi:fatty-acyl-CoA synthase